MLKPLLDRVLVRRVTHAKPESVIEIPDAYRQQSREGIVEALGDFVVTGGLRVPLSDLLKLGDRVLFGEYNAEPLDDASDLLLVRVQDIRGIYEQ